MMVEATSNYMAVSAGITPPFNVAITSTGSAMNENSSSSNSNNTNNNIAGNHNGSSSKLMTTSSTSNSVSSHQPKYIFPLSSNSKEVTTTQLPLNPLNTQQPDFNSFHRLNMFTTGSSSSSGSSSESPSSSSPLLMNRIQTMQQASYPPQPSSTGSISPHSNLSSSVSPAVFPSPPYSSNSQNDLATSYTWNTYPGLSARSQFHYHQYASDYYGNMSMPSAAAAATAGPWFTHDRLYQSAWPSPANTYGFNFEDIAFQTQLQRRSVRCTCPNCTNEMSGLPPIVGPDERGRKQHICHIPGCERLYGKASHLKTHLRWHTGERPFICLTCGKRFSRSDELQRHGRTHTNYRPYSCPHCVKKFSRSDHLSKHKKTHFKDKKSKKAEKDSTNNKKSTTTSSNSNTNNESNNDVNKNTKINVSTSAGSSNNLTIKVATTKIPPTNLIPTTTVMSANNERDLINRNKLYSTRNEINSTVHQYSSSHNSSESNNSNSNIKDSSNASNNSNTTYSPSTNMQLPLNSINSTSYMKSEPLATSNEVSPGYSYLYPPNISSPSSSSTTSSSSSLGNNNSSIQMIPSAIVPLSPQAAIISSSSTSSAPDFPLSSTAGINIYHPYGQHGISSQHHQYYPHQYALNSINNKLNQHNNNSEEKQISTSILRNSQLEQNNQEEANKETLSKQPSTSSIHQNALNLNQPGVVNSYDSTSHLQQNSYSTNSASFGGGHPSYHYSSMHHTPYGHHFHRHEFNYGSNSNINDNLSSPSNNSNNDCSNSSSTTNAGSSGTSEGNLRLPTGAGYHWPNY